MNKIQNTTPIISIKRALGDNLGYQNVKEKSLQTLFLKKLNEKQQEYNRMNKPFDYLCAKMDYEDALETFYKELRRGADPEREAKKLEIDLDKYGNLSRFELLKEYSKKESKLIDGMRRNVITFRVFEYRSKLRGNGITIHMPIGDWDEMKLEKVEKAKTVTPPATGE